jgi:hypothetical protein
MPVGWSGPQTNARIFGASRSQAAGCRIGTEFNMGAGARLAAERDRWPEHWRFADLEREEDFLLAMLEPAEELRAVIPGTRSTPDDGDEQILIGVTDRRVVLVSRQRSDLEHPRAIDVTDCAPTAPRGQRLVPHYGGHLEFDIDEDAIARMWTTIDDVDRRDAADA